MIEKLAFSIRLANPEDAPIIIEVHYASVHGIASAFYDADIINDWSPMPISAERINDLAGRIKRCEEIVFVAENDAKQIVGFSSVVLDQSELRAIYVRPDHGKQGIGGLLLKALENFARKSSLIELNTDSSINAEQFYLSHGYQIIHYGEHILRSGRHMDCIKMKKILGKPDVPS